MTAAVAEQLNYFPGLESDATPIVLTVPEMGEDLLVRQRAARFIGKCVAGQEIDTLSNPDVESLSPIESLYDAIQLAAEGDITATNLVTTNVRTDVIERTIKAGHVIKVDLHVDDNGNIQQHGQTMESVQANSLRLASELPQMRERTEAEATNAFRINQFYNQGILEDYCFVVFSRAADNMTKAQMDKAGFFTDTMSCAIQVTSSEDGILSTESAFVAGTESPDADRHDAQTIARLGDVLGVDYRNKSAAKTIDTPVLVHKSFMPNGAIDLVELWDACNEGTFFGEAKPRQDYLDYRSKCEEREAMLMPKVDAIVQELISLAPSINSKLEAVRQLHKISEKHMVEQAVFDTEINPMVFGPVAAEHIVQSRIQFEMGNNAEGLNLINKAKDTAKSSSCPSALKDSNKNEFELDTEEDSNKNDDKDCEFVSKECPKCGTKNVKTKVTKHKISGSCGCSVKK